GEIIMSGIKADLRDIGAALLASVVTVLIAMWFVAATSAPALIPVSRAGVAAAHVATLAASITPAGPRAESPGGAVPHPRQCARASKRVARDLGDTGLTWQYADRAMQRQFHVGPCAVIIVGSDRPADHGQSEVMRPDGRIVPGSQS